MQIIEIEDPGSAGSKQSGELIVGIDFGTTNSLIAIAKDADVQFFKTDSGSELLPSIVYLEASNNGFAVGSKQAKLNGSVRSIKRLLAKSYSEIANNVVLSTLIEDGILAESDGRPVIKFDAAADQDYSIPLIASEIFKSLKRSVFTELGITDNKSIKAVVSVPAYFNDNERGQVMLAAKYAGIEIIRLIPEPTAAAYAYGLQQQTKGTYLVYDLGGGTFDVSILDMSEGVLQVIACGGDNNLGGDDLDLAIAQYIVRKYGLESSIEVSPQLIAQAKQLKEDLSAKGRSSVDINGKEFAFTIEDINFAIEGLIGNTIKIAKDVYFEAAEPNLDGIIMVGGSTRTALIAKKLQQTFPVKIYNEIDPDKAVAWGAALQAENLVANKGNLLIDVLPLSVGLELYGGLFEKIILRNTPLPFSVSKEFTTQADFQTGMDLHILQGEREMAADCRSLARLELKGLSSKKAGMVKVLVKFAMDADGILSVSANEVDSDKVISATCKPGYGLSEQQVAADLEKAYANAALDHQQRLMTETKIEAIELISGLKIALQQTPDIISDIEYNQINDKIGALEKLINNATGIQDRDFIIAKMQELNGNAASFIEKHLNIGADKIIVGKNIKDLEK